MSKVFNHYEARSTGEQSVGIRLKCLLMIRAITRATFTSIVVLWIKLSPHCCVSCRVNNTSMDVYFFLTIASFSYTHQSSCSVNDEWRIIIQCTDSIRASVSFSIQHSAFSWCPCDEWHIHKKHKYKRKQNRTLTATYIRDSMRILINEAVRWHQTQTHWDRELYTSVFSANTRVVISRVSYFVLNAHWLIDHCSFLWINFHEPEDRNQLLEVSKFLSVYWVLVNVLLLSLLHLLLFLFKIFV